MNKINDNLYTFEGQQDIVSPQLVYYPAIIRENIRKMIDIAGGAARLWPHIKTHKMAEVVQMQIEAGISVNPDAYRANYVALTYGKSREYLLEECFPADVIIPADAEHLDFCGARFGILQLPGHSAGHIGVVTPDGVAYLGDCLIDEEQIAAAKLPTSMFIARDLESKESLRNLRRPAYIIAHKQVLTDIGPLIDRNIAFIHDKGRELLEDLEDGMSFDQWIYAFCQRENVRTRNEFKFSIVERNFANFVDWLTDEGKVEVRREFCAKHYFHAEK